MDCLLVENSLGKLQINSDELFDLIPIKLIGLGGQINHPTIHL